LCQSYAEPVHTVPYPRIARLPGKGFVVSVCGQYRCHSRIVRLPANRFVGGINRQHRYCQLFSFANPQTTIAIVETFTKMRELACTVSELTTTTAKPKQKSLMQKSGEIIADILDNDLQISDTETSFEIDLAVMKFKHIVRQKRQNTSNKTDKAASLRKEKN
jgi:hypothetical protein